ncbi:general substrate transporter [Aspergillus granulosus]|uniref:General substrate transporter n=1 Tax=Aspergillus granulosus TaxID=176169 RepID=A0ABR4HYN9_9EURO
MGETEKVEQDVLEVVEQTSPGSKTDESYDEQRSPWEAAKASPKAIICCTIMSLSPLVTGFDNIIIGLVTAMPAFQMVYGEASGVIPAQWLSLWTSMVAVGVIIGAMLSGPMSDRWGCRVPVLIGGFIAVAGSIICAFADELEVLQNRRILFLFAKIIVGLGMGFMLPASQTYISEVAPVELKGPLLSAYTLSMVCGQVIAVAGVNARITIFSRMAYRLLLAIEAIPTGFAALAPCFIPESPNFFVKRGNIPKAITAYTRLFSEAQAEPTVQRLARALEHERGVQESAEAPSFQECFHGANWRRTRIVCYANMLQSFVGMAMIQNATYFFQLGGMSAQNSLNVTTASLCLLIPALLLSWYLMGRLGRRTILLCATSVIMVLWMAVGVGGCFGTTTAFWFVGCAIVVTNFVYGLGVGSVYPVVAAETSALRLRAKTQALGFAVQFVVSWVFQYVVPYMYSPAEGHLGGKVGFIFSGLSAIALAVIFFEIPEMKGLRVEELDARFEQRLPTRTFQRAVVSQAEA